MEKKMKKIGLLMNLCMGITLSFFLSLAGTLTSGHFAVPEWLISFGISAVISIIIGFIVPMKKINDAIEKRPGCEPGKLTTRLVESAISDLIYTPILSLCMVIFARSRALAHGAQLPPFLIMYAKSLLATLVVGFFLILVFTPIFLKILLKKNGIGGPVDK